MLALPIGPPGGAMHLALDPLAAAFLLLVFVAAIPCAIFAGVEQDAALAGGPGFAGGDRIHTARGRCLRAGAGAGRAGHCRPALAVVPAGCRRSRARLRRPISALAIFAAVCMVVALALMAPPSIAWLDCDYAAIRAAPPEGSRASVALLLTLMGAAGLAVIAYLHVRVPRFAGVSVLFAGVGANIGIYLLFRVLLDLGGSAPSLLAWRASLSLPARYICRSGRAAREAGASASSPSSR